MIKKYISLFLIFITFVNASIALENGDFEVGTETNITGWDGGPVKYDNTYSGYNGSRYAFMDSSQKPTPLTQTIDIKANMEYEVKFLAGCNYTGFTAITGCMQQKVTISDDTGESNSTNIDNLVTSTGLQEYSLKLKTGDSATKLTIKIEVGNSFLLSNTYIYFDYFRVDIEPSYCQANSLPEGFNVIDPDGGDNKNSFEIFCYKDSNSKMHDLIALPIKNNSNNFVFENNTTTTNYYDTTANPRTDFYAIEVAVNKVEYNGTLENGAPKPYFPVVTREQREPEDIITDGKTYKVMRSTFSNINLIATPFEIDWSNTDVDECDATQLRKALNQAVKYNTLLQDQHSICHINKMTISLQDKYRYLTYLGDEVLKKSCKEMAEYVPNNVGVLDDTSIAGYFNIDPFEKGRGGLDIGEKGRPITAWCKYQQDLGWVWTFLTALDAKVTNSKIDLMNKEDTCSELGLYFFVPNSKETFDRVRRYLKNQKNGDEGWENYTGTIREKYKAYTNDPKKEYYLRKIGYELIWPYGPLGIYYPCNGHRDANQKCKKRKWYSGKYYIRTWMSGSAMHNIPTMSNYSDSMGKNGWVSILGEQDLNKTNEWWVSDVGAGKEVGYEDPSRYEYSPHGVHKYQSVDFKYYEPNGNYKKYAWLNFVHDSEGWIYHNDDNNDFYAYYDYLCMSETNYDTTTRYALVPGFFNAIERSTTAQNTPPEFSDDKVRTKIVNKDIDLDIILYEYDPNTGTIDRTQLEEEENKSVGVFLSTFNDKGELKLLRFLEEIENFDGNNGRIELSPFKLSSSVKEAYIHFYYCNPVGMNWQECWNFNGSVDYPIVTKKNDLGGESDSYDKFAIRPDRFEIDINVSQNSSGEYYTVAGKEITIDFKANDYTNSPSVNYNEELIDANSSFNISYEEDKYSIGCQKGDFEPVVDENWSFTNGEYNLKTNYNEVGKIKLSIQENVGNEFAKVDALDTNESNRLIKEYNVTINFSPDHFDIESKLYNSNQSNFTYLSNDLNMSAFIDLNISAKNANGDLTKNYNSKCYAKDINISSDIVYNPDSFTPNNLDYLIYNIYYDKNIKLIDDTNSSLDKIETNTITKDVFSSIDEGRALLTINLNYPRKFNEPINPFDINITKIEALDTDKIEGSQDNIGTARFYYAKTKSESEFYDDVEEESVLTPIEINIFCNNSLDECQKFGIDTNKTATNEYDWWLSSEHNNSSKNGNVELQPDNSEAKITPALITEFINGKDKNVTVEYPISSPRPVIIKIEPTLNMINNYPWLLYNASEDKAPKYIYRVRFIDTPSAWSGEGNTGHSINVNSSGKKSNKVDW